MLFYTAGQGRVFLLMVYAGMLSGAWIALVRSASRLFGAGAALSLFMNLLSGLGAALPVLAGLVLSSGGEMRLYALMGAVCGALLYAATLHPLLKALRRRAAHLLSSAWKWIRRRALVKKLLK